MNIIYYLINLLINHIKMWIETKETEGKSRSGFFNKSFIKSIKEIFKPKTKETTTLTKFWKYSINEKILVEPKRNEFVFEGSVVGGYIEDGDRYIKVRYEDVNWEEKEETYSEDDLTKWNNKFETSNDYSTGNRVKLRYNWVIIVGSISNWNRKDWKVKIQIIGNNEFVERTKEQLDKLNKKPEIKNEDDKEN